MTDYKVDAESRNVARDINHSLQKAATRPRSCKDKSPHEKTCHRDNFRPKFICEYFMRVDRWGKDCADRFFLCAESLDDFAKRINCADVARENYVAHAGKFAFRTDFPNGNAGRDLSENESFFDAETFRANVA